METIINLISIPKGWQTLEKERDTDKERNTDIESQSLSDIERDKKGRKY